MVSSDADHRSYQRRRPLQALRWRERRSCHLSLGSRCPTCEEASVKVACRRVRGRRRPQRPVPGANDGAPAANTQCQPAEARTSPPRSRGHRPTRTTRPAQSRRHRRPRRATARHERRGPLKVEDVAARNGPPPVTNDEARVVVILVSKLECLERSGRAQSRRIKRERSNGAAGAGPHPATCDDARGERRRALLSRASCAASLAENATIVNASYGSN